MTGLVGLFGAALGLVGSWVLQKGQREHDREVSRSETLQHLLDEPLENLSKMIEAGAAIVNIFARINSNIEGIATREALNHRLETYWEAENRAVISLITLDPQGDIGNQILHFKRGLTAAMAPIRAGNEVGVNDLVSLQTILAGITEGRDHLRKESLNGL